MVQEILSKKMEYVLKAQIALMDNIYRLQRKVYDNVLHRDWENTKEGMNSLDELSEQFTIEDKKLAMLLDEANKTYAGKTEETEEALDLEEVIKHFSGRSQAILLNLYKTLKEKVFLSKIENDVFNNYVDHARSLVNGVFDVVAHNRSGQTYTRTGVKADSDVSNLVINRVF